MNTYIRFAYCISFSGVLLVSACGQGAPQSSSKERSIESGTHVQAAAPNSTAMGSADTNNAQPAASHPDPGTVTATGSSQLNAPAPSIPDFTFYILKSGIRFEREDLNKDHRHVFVLFDPSCTYCQHEAKDIGKNIDTFTNTSFYFISMNDPGLMATFFSRFAKELENRENVYMLYDRNVQFVNKFHVPSQYPATYVYDKSQTLKTYWNGVKSTAEIISAIKE